MKKVWVLTMLLFIIGSISAFADSKEPLHNAIENNDMAAVKRIINSSNISSIKIVRYWGGKADGYLDVSPLSVACMYEKYEIAKWMLDQGSDPNGGGSYDTPLWWVAFKGERYKGSSYHREYLEMAELLLKRGAKPDYNTSKYNGSPLMRAAGGNDVQMVELLLRYGGNASSVLYEEHGSAADYAERGGHIELANRLRGKSSDEYRNSLIYAVKNNNIGRVRTLIAGERDSAARSALVNRQEEKSLNTPLHYAAQLGYRDIAAVLVENGADINKQSIGSFTPLHTAAAYSRTDVAIYLVNCGADINVVQSSGCATGYTSLNWALEHSDTELIRAMMRKGADPFVGRRHPLEQARTLTIAKMLVEEFNLMPTNEVFENLNSILREYDSRYKSYYDEKQRIYDYLKQQNIAPMAMRVRSSMKNVDTTQQLFEPINVNEDPAKRFSSGRKGKGGRNR